MSTIAKIQIRKGAIADLPILDAGEMGYATDVQRLFIGNNTIARSGNGATTEFDFGVDFDSLPLYQFTIDGNAINTSALTVLGDGTSIRIQINDVTTQTVALNTDFTFALGFTLNLVELSTDNGLTWTPQTSPAQYDVTGNTVTFVNAPAVNDQVRITGAPNAGPPNIILNYNTEVYTVSPDSGVELPISQSLSAQVSPVNVGITIDSNRYDSVEIDYVLKHTTNPTQVRKGTIRIGITAPGGSFTIDDQYNTTSISSTVLTHVFSGSLVTDLFQLQYISPDPTQTTFSYITKNWKSV